MMDVRRFSLELFIVRAAALVLLHIILVPLSPADFVFDVVLVAAAAVKGLKVVVVVRREVMVMVVVQRRVRRQRGDHPGRHGRRGRCR